MSVDNPRLQQHRRAGHDFTHPYWSDHRAPSARRVNRFKSMPDAALPHSI